MVALNEMADCTECYVIIYNWAWETELAELKFIDMGIFIAFDVYYALSFLQTLYSKVVTHYLWNKNLEYIQNKGKGWGLQSAYISKLEI